MANQRRSVEALQLLLAGRERHLSLYHVGGADEAFRRTAIAENDQSDEWKVYRRMVVQVLAGLTMAGYAVSP